MLRDHRLALPYLFFGKTGHSHSVLAISQKGGLANFLGVLHPPPKRKAHSQTQFCPRLTVSTIVQVTWLRSRRRSGVPGWQEGLGDSKPNETVGLCGVGTVIRGQRTEWGLLCPESAPPLHPGWATVSSNRTS